MHTREEPDVMQNSNAYADRLPSHPEEPQLPVADSGGRPPHDKHETNEQHVKTTRTLTQRLTSQMGEADRSFGRTCA